MATRDFNKKHGSASELQSRFMNDLDAWHSFCARVIRNVLEPGKNLHDALQAVLELSLVLTNAPAAIICMNAGEKGHFIEIASHGFSSEQALMVRQGSLLKKKLTDALIPDIAAVAGDFEYIPLSGGKSPVGFLAIYLSSEHKESADVKVMLRKLEDEISSGLERLHVLDDSKRQDILAKASLIHLGKAMGSTLDIKRLSRQITQAGLAILEADLCDVLLYKGENFEFQAASGLNKIFKGFSDIQVKYDPAATIVKQLCPMSIRHIRSSSRFFNRPWMKHDKYKSYIGVPIQQDDEIIGVLEAFSKQQGKFASNDTRVLQSLAGPIAAALRNIKFLEETRLKAEKLKILNQHITRIVAERDIDKIMQEVSKAARNAVGSLLAYSALYNEQKQTFENQAYDVDERLQSDSGSGKPALTIDKELLNRHINWMREAVFTSEQPVHIETGIDTHDGAIIPMVVSPLLNSDKNVCGLVAVGLREDGSAFTQDHRDVLSTLANQASIAIDNAMLYKQAVDKANTLAATLDASRTITGEIDQYLIFKRIAQAVRSMFDVRQGCIYLSDRTAKSLYEAYKWGAGSKSAPHKRIPLDDRTILSEAFKKQQELIVDALDPSFADELGCGILQAQRKSAIAIPIVAKGKSLGILVLAVDEPAFFNVDKLSILHILTNQFAIAIRNNHLLGRVIEEEVARREAEMSLELLTEKARNSIIVEQTQEGIFMIDSDYIIKLFNPALEALTGKSAAQALGKKCFDLFNDLYEEENLCENCPLRNEEPIAEGRIKAQIRLKSGPATIVEIAHSRLDNDKNNGAVVTLRDVTKDHELEVYHHDLRIATEVQQNILPHERPEIDGLDIGFMCRPAKQIGGDYFDFIQLSNDKLGIAIGDVAGKSLPAALLVSMHKYILRSAAANTDSVISPLRSLNRILWEDTSPEVFVTTIYGVYDIPSSTFVYGNAGHVPPVLYANGQARYLWTPQTPLGIYQNLFVEQQQITLEEGNIVVLLSDGVIDIRNSKGKSFGFERLRRIVKKNPHLTAQEMADTIFEQTIAFSTGELTDDFTIVVLKCTKSGRSKHIKELVVMNSPIAVNDVRHFLKEELKSTPLPQIDHSDVLVAACEGVTNSVLHGQSPDGEDNNIRVSCAAKDDYFEISISDNGIGYYPDLTQWRPPDLIRDRGRGIYMMQELMDQVEYVPADRGTTIVMRKSFRH